eukprot:294465-Hanusia_phi.AAC.1
MKIISFLLWLRFKSRFECSSNAESLAECQVAILPGRALEITVRPPCVCRARSCAPGHAPPGIPGRVRQVAGPRGLSRPDHAGQSTVRWSGLCGSGVTGPAPGPARVSEADGRAAFAELGLSIA